MSFTLGQKVLVAGRRFYVRMAGEGPAVLLIHGLPTSGLLWQDVAPLLATRARIVVPDLLGYGRSDQPEGLPVDVASQAAYLIELLDTLEIDCVTVAGHDIGGGIAQYLAVRHTERVERLGLINTVAYDNWPVPQARLLQRLAPLARHVPPSIVLRSIQRGLRRGFLHRDRAGAFLQACLEPFDSREGLRTLLDHVETLQAGFTERVAPYLRALHMPTAVIWGSHDPFLKPEYATRLAAEIPGANLTWIEAGHFGPVDAPEDVADALVRLLHRPVGERVTAGSAA